MSKEDSSLDEDEEETYESSIVTSTSTSSSSKEATLDIHGEPYSNSECKINTSNIPDFDTNSSNNHDPSECEINMPDAETLIVILTK